VNPLRNGSESIEIDLMYLMYLSQARVCFEEVPGSTAFLVAVSAADISARKFFHLEVGKF